MLRAGAHNDYIERRNHTTRAQTLCRVLNWLLRDSTGDTATPAEVPDEVAGDAAAGRILRRLACRGLVRCVSGAWMPAPALLHPARLIPCSIDVDPVKID